MPELPEVETVRRGLQPVLEGQRIRRAVIRRADLRWPFPPDMGARLTGQTVTALRRRSKYILADLSSGETLLVHLGMSGRVLISRHESALSAEIMHLPQSAAEKHDHVVLDLTNGARIAFNDARRFGAMDLADTAQVDAHKLLAGLGPEPLGNSFDEIYLARALAGRNTPIKAALLDQHIIAGLGNIYVCEALHRARINPKRKAGSLSRARITTLVPVIRDVLMDAIAAGGSTLRDYRRASGELGYFQHSFRAYGREGLRCLTPGCDGTIARIVQSGRSTFYCPRCQR